MVSKMAIQEAPELISYHAHTESTATHERTPSETIQKLTEQLLYILANQKIPSSKQVGKAEMHSYHKPHFLYQNIPRWYLPFLRLLQKGLTVKQSDFMTIFYWYRPRYFHFIIVHPEFAKDHNIVNNLSCLALCFFFFLIFYQLSLNSNNTIQIQCHGSKFNKRSPI